VIAIIEIPKGDGIRRHFKKTKDGFVELGLIKEIIPINDGLMPIAYGFIPNTLNSGDDDELDVIVYSEKDFHVGEKVNITAVGIILREDNDHKVIAVEEYSNINWNDIPEDEKKLIVDFMGFNSPISEIKGSTDALEYIDRYLSKEKIPYLKSF
jgi:inorganic pyrophosphatase